MGVVVLYDVTVTSCVCDGMIGRSFQYCLYSSPVITSYLYAGLML